MLRWERRTATANLGLSTHGTRHPSLGGCYPTSTAAGATEGPAHPCQGSRPLRTLGLGLGTQGSKSSLKRFKWTNERQPRHCLRPGCPVRQSQDFWRAGPPAVSILSLLTALSRTLNLLFWDNVGFIEELRSNILLLSGFHSHWCFR